MDQLRRDFTVPAQRNRSWWASLTGAGKVVRALDGVSFAVPGGERLALLGRNGSGKSTLVKLLTGVVTPTSGRAKVLGFVPWHRRRAYLRRIGVMFGQKSLLFPDLTVGDALRLYRVVYEVSEDAFRASLRDLDEHLQFSRLIDRPVRKLSLGERMRCEVAAALVHRPEVIFLDEPTIGMDPETRAGLGVYLHNHVGPGQTLVVTTHELGLIKRLCSRVLIMREGRLAHDLPLSEVADRVESVRVEARYRRIDSPTALQAALDGTRLVERRDGALTIDCPASLEERIKKQLSQAVDLISLTASEPPLDAVLEDLIAGPSPPGNLAGGSS